MPTDKYFINGREVSELEFDATLNTAIYKHIDQSGEFNSYLNTKYGQVDIAGFTVLTSAALQKVAPYVYDDMLTNFVNRRLLDTYYELRTSDMPKTINNNVFFIEED